MGHLMGSKTPYPTPDALVALRNSRLWEAHAQRSTGTERDSAQRAATQWSDTYRMLMSTAPGTRAVPLRRGDREKKWTVSSVLQAVMLLALVVFLISRVYLAFFA